MENQKNIKKPLLEKIKETAFFQKAEKLYGKVRGVFDLRKKKNILKLIGNIVLYAVMIVISYIFITPLIDIVAKSFMNQKDIIDPEVFYLPKSFTFGNFKVAISALDLWASLFNSIWFSALLGVIQTIISAVTAYSFARYDFKGKKIWFALLIVSFIIPLPVLIVPRITIFSGIQDILHIKMMGSLIPNILTTLLGQGIYSTILILIFYNFFKQIPYDLDEAAYMDGATSLQVLWHVIIKLSLPVILTVFLFSFVWNWNESIMTNTFVRSALKLVPSQLAAFDSLFSSSQVGNSVVDLNEGFKMAGTLVSILPLIILYLFVQRKFIEGIEQTGITGV